MKEKFLSILKIVLLCLFALLIPGMLILNSFQSKRYVEVERSVYDLVEKQVNLIEQNKRLITDIGVLSSSQRIENVAEENLGMREAETEEIIRVEMK